MNDFSAHAARNLLMANLPPGSAEDDHKRIKQTLQSIGIRQGSPEADLVSNMMTRSRAVDRAVEQGLMFWLGDFLPSFNDENIQRGGRMWGSGEIGHPFGADPYACAYAVRAAPDGEAPVDMGIILQVMPLDDYLWKDGRRARRVMCFYSEYRNDVPGVRGWTRTGHNILKIESDGTDVMDMEIADLPITMQNSPLLPPAAKIPRDIVMMMYFNILQLLNTDGIPKSTGSTDPKLARARARSGKKPLPDYINLDTKAYVTALLNGHDYEASDPILAGDPRSLVPHRRRAHWRYLPPDRQRRVWVRDAMVNADKIDPAHPPKTRLFYDASRLQAPQQDQHL
jgi:hypothetical protein